MSDSYGVPSPRLLARAEGGLERFNRKVAGDTGMAVPAWIRIGAGATDTVAGVTGRISQIGRGLTYREPRPEHVWLRDGDTPPHLARIDDLKPAEQ